MESKTGRRMSVQRGRRVSTISNPMSVSRRPDTKLSDAPAFSRDKLVTYTLAYSTSVEKAFKRNYRSTFFGPLSGHPRRSEPILEVENLPQLYSDFIYINELVVRNQVFAKKLLEESTESTEDPGKLLKLPKVGRSRKISRSRDSNPSTPTVTKLPQISQNSCSSMSVTLGGSSSSSDNAVQVG